MARGRIHIPWNHEAVQALLLVIVVAWLLEACTWQSKSDESQAIHVTSVCVLSLCEESKKIERIGDPQAEGSDIVIQDSETDNAQVTQGEDADADVGVGAPLAPGIIQSGGNILDEAADALPDLDL